MLADNLKLDVDEIIKEKLQKKCGEISGGTKQGFQKKYREL
ncbi:hypothetical protein ODV97_09090 [Enterococcus gallinarum]|nr:hypothetical protein [Enterococcus gallinarum]